MGFAFPANFRMIVAWAGTLSVHGPIRSEMAQARDVWQELALRDLAACGRADAWRTLYDESFESVAAYVRWRASGLPDLVDDVLQESWMTAIRPSDTNGCCERNIWNA